MENTKGTTTGIDGKQETWAIDQTGTQALDAIDGTSDNIQPSVNQAVSGAQRTFDRLSERATQAKAMLSERFEQVRGQQGKWADDARVRVRENPMMAVGIAVAAGFVLRRLFSRSRY